MAMLPRQQVADALLHRISTGQLPPGQRLPTELALAAEFSVSRGTVRSALQVLAEQGAVELQRGVGCFVRSTAKTAERNLIMFLHPQTDELTSRMVSGMESRASEFGCELGIGSISAGVESAWQFAAKLKFERVRGIIFIPYIQPNYYDVNSRLLDLFEFCNLRYVVIDTPIACNGVIRGDFVGNDGYTAMRQVVRALIERGHRRIGSIRVFAGVYSSDQRFRGIVDELNAAGLPVSPELHRVIDDVPLPEQGRAQIHDILRLSSPPSAVIASHDLLALNVFDELRRVGRRVPEDLSLFGFDDLYFTAPLEISTVRQPQYAIGRRAVEFLLNPAAARRQEFLPCEVVIRNSVSPYYLIKEA
ncbi:GntR family transcriptional regulator [Victivallaceae bacterium BBE-744-WT-12]|uniref:GntR family transcriptional regulator n=1 Tax=Victivallis lenta TaxID=2606640 RepID=A0A844GBC3_9BACT|nr:GntR family transcriptional regulator [Victivallis lenta]MST99668.1 GntR family transcriptional regulator [Victivallis lenta]